MRPYKHTGNRNRALEEVEAVQRLVDELLAAAATWTDMHGETHDIELAES